MKLAIFKIGVIIIICAQVFAVFMILRPEEKERKTRIKLEKTAYQYGEPIDQANDNDLNNRK